MRPLTGVRVLSVEQYGAGPFGTQYMSDMGAEVIKIENPTDGGDMSRAVGPYFIEGAEDSTSASLFYQSFNRNKRSLTLNLGTDEGKAIFRKLVAKADGVCSNMRGDVPEKLGLTYKHLGDFNPKIVCAHLSAYGRTGSRAAWPGYDYLMQAEAGYFSLTGEPGTAPARFGQSVVDMMTGLGLSYAFLCGLIQARTTGIGRDIDVSLYDFAHYHLSYLGQWYLSHGHVQGREERSAHPSLTPCALYKTGDGWIYLMCNKEKFWPILCEKVGRPDAATDPRFLRFADRLKNRKLVQDLLDEALQAKTTAEWIEVFAGSVPAAPLMDVQEAIENPFAAERGRVETIKHQSGIDFRMLTTPITLTGDEAEENRPGPELGDATEDLLAEIGIEGDEIAALKERGVV